MVNISDKLAGKFIGGISHLVITDVYVYKIFCDLIVIKSMKHRLDEAIFIINNKEKK